MSDVKIVHFPLKAMSSARYFGDEADAGGLGDTGDDVYDYTVDDRNRSDFESSEEHSR